MTASSDFRECYVDFCLLAIAVLCERWTSHDTRHIISHHFAEPPSSHKINNSQEAATITPAGRCYVVTLHTTTQAARLDGCRRPARPSEHDRSDPEMARTQKSACVNTHMWGGSSRGPSGHARGRLWLEPGVGKPGAAAAAWRARTLKGPAQAAFRRAAPAIARSPPESPHQ